ncbi:MAG: hypothetical protein ACE5JI_02335 [Acidobacteriota bacterium]
MPSRRAHILMAATVLFFVLSTVGMREGVEPFATWYYSFAWWSYILFLDAWLTRRNRPSLVLGNAEAPRLLGLSVVIWTIFETYNLRLGNWYYLEIPSELLLRWTGYGVAYAAVLPGIFVTREMLASLAGPGLGARKALPRRLSGVLFWIGLTASLLPWIWPRYCFPLIWLGPTALFAAINYRYLGGGLLKELELHGPSKLYQLLGAGAICGFLWELWNHWARSKWMYNIPFFDRVPVFEMPLAGYLGFPPFAVECHEMYVTGKSLLSRLDQRGVRWVPRLLLAALVAAAFWGIDSLTVKSFQ